MIEMKMKFILLFLSILAVSYGDSFDDPQILCKCIIALDNKEIEVDVFELGFNVTYSIPGYIFNTSILVDCTYHCINNFTKVTDDFNLDHIVKKIEGIELSLGQIICDTKSTMKFESSCNLHAVIDWLKPDGSQEAYVSPHAVSVSKTKLACDHKRYISNYVDSN